MSMKKYNKLFESTIKSLVICFDENKNVQVYKSKDSFAVLKQNLIRNGYKGIYQLPLSLFTDDTLRVGNVSKKIVSYMLDIKKNYNSLDEIPEI